MHTVLNGKELDCQQILRLHRRLYPDDRQPTARQVKESKSLEPDDRHQALYAADAQLRQLPQPYNP